MTKRIFLFPLAVGAGLTFATSAYSAVPYFEDFAADVSGGDQPISAVGWNNAIDDFDTRIYSEPAGNAGTAIWSWVGGDAGAFMEVFYTTSDTPGSGFGNIDLALNPDFTFTVDIQSQNTGTENTFGHFAVKIEDQWYATAEPVPAPSGDWATHTMDFNSAASAWQSLAIPNEGTTSLGESGTFGAAPGSDLAGTIVGVGYVVDRSEGNGTQNFTNFGVVPEPSTYAVLAGLLALAASFFFRNRRRKV